MALGKDKVAVQFSCPKELNERIKDFGKKNGLSTSGAIVMLLNQHFRGLELTGELARAIKGLSDEQLQGMLSESVTGVREALENSDIE